MEIRNKHKRKKTLTKGATLLETVIYTTLLTLLTVTTVAGILTLNNSLQSIVLGRIMDDAAQEVMEKVIREIRFADTVDQTKSTLSVNPSVLVLDSQDISGIPVETEFSISGDTLELRRDGVLVGPLTPEQVIIDELVFDHIMTPESEAVKVSLVLTVSRAGVELEETFNTTVVLRSSY